MKPSLHDQAPLPAPRPAWRHKQDPPVREGKTLHCCAQEGLAEEEEELLGTIPRGSNTLRGPPFPSFWPLGGQPSCPAHPKWPHGPCRAGSLPQGRLGQEGGGSEEALLPLARLPCTLPSLGASRERGTPKAGNGHLPHCGATHTNETRRTRLRLEKLHVF